VGGSIAASGNMTATGTVQGGYVYSSGNITAAGTVQGGYIYSTGSIAAASAVSGASMSASGNITAGGTVQGGSVNSTGNISASSYVYAGSYLKAGSRFYIETVNMDVKTYYTEIPHSWASYKGNYILMAWKADTGAGWASGIWACSKQGQSGVSGYTPAISYQSDASGNNLNVSWPADNSKIVVSYGSDQTYTITLMGHIF